MAVTEQELIEELEISEEEIRNSQAGIFKRTFLEMWGTSLVNNINASEAPITIELTSAILHNYDWLDHTTVQAYRARRVELMKEALQVLEDIIGDEKARKKLFEEAEGDWEKHRDMYLDIIAGWLRLTVKWTDAWTTRAVEEDYLDPVDHAAIIDVSAMLTNPDFGFVESLRNLAGFELSEEDRARLDAALKPEDDTDE